MRSIANIRLDRDLVSMRYWRAEGHLVRDQVDDVALFTSTQKAQACVAAIDDIPELCDLVEEQRAALRTALAHIRLGLVDVASMVLQTALGEEVPA